ncbi:MAG TPA: T9SS type A sorting domain-containing protein [Candidatus Marinimicrobia bacterium]|nr:T9SS type A sorting domain-containing protein [Candidatus Neomarinimicrobiota bacterium]
MIMSNTVKRYLTSGIMLFSLIALPLQAQNAADGFSVSWTLDATTDANLFPFSGFGAQSVLAGMDFDGDGRREILFSMDETLAPGGPDPGLLGIYLYESNGNDSYEYVWSFITPEPGNSLPGMAYGDIDSDGLWEIYFGQPPASGSNDNTWGTYIFEQGADGTFPSTATMLFQYGLSYTDNFRPSGFVISDVDGDGVKELITIDRGTRKLSIDQLATSSFDEFASFTNEFLDTENLGGGGVYNLDVVDFDGDGKNEIWVNTWDNFSLAIFEADSADSYSLQVDLNSLFPDNDPGSFRRSGFAFADPDDDGKLECWFPMTNGKLYYLESVDSSVADLSGDDFTELGTFGGRNRGSDMGDIDGDGKPDIVASRGTEEIVARIEYQGGDPQDSTSYVWGDILESSGEPLDRYYSVDIAPVDLDGDGLREIVLANIKASEAGQFAIVVLEYDPGSAATLADGWDMSATATPADADYSDSTYGGSSRTAIAGMDMDQDGMYEVILTDYAHNRVHVFEYNNGVFEAVWSSPEDTASHYWANPRTVGVGDLDGDGKEEIVFPRATTGLEGWWVFEWDGVVGSDNYGTTYSSINMVEIDTCCAGDGSSFRGDHERTTIMDIDGDGVQELVIAVRRGSTRGTLITSVSGDIEHNAGGAGFETWVSEGFVNKSNYGGGSPYQSLPADLDGDGSYELVNHTWNYLNFYNIDVTGPDTYVAAEVGATDSYYQATYPSDHVSLFGGAAADLDGDGDDEAYFPNYYTGDLWVIDYESGDDVLVINSDHVVNVVTNAGAFHASIFDVDQDGMPNIFVGSGRGQVITSIELAADGDPREPSDYETTVVYTGENDVYSNITVVDSGGIQTTSLSHAGTFATKVQAEWNGEGLDFDGDGYYEVIASFQGNVDSTTTTTYTHNGTSWDTTVTAVVNPKNWIILQLEFTDVEVSISEITFITPDDYKLLPNYPNPFNPTTRIEYVLPLQKNVTVRIYNMLGQVVRTLVNNEMKPAGHHSVSWNGFNDAGMKVASGAYIYSLEWGNFRKTNKMMLMK